MAQSRNVPRGRILKDDALVELAANRPKTAEELAKSRLLLREARRGEIADGILAAIAAAEAVPPAEVPWRRSRRSARPGRRRWRTCCGCC
jgi:ribonuclease D